MTEPQTRIINEIEIAASGTQMIPAARVKAWMEAGRDSVEILGAVTVHVIQNSRRVDPPLSMEEICTTVQEYYKQCLIQNLQESQYAPNRSIAGLELVDWFKMLWRDPAVPREYLVRLKTMLRELYAKDTIPHNEMTGAVLEHLLETPEIAEFFADWAADPRLKESFDLAMEWANDHSAPSAPQEPGDLT